LRASPWASLFPKVSAFSLFFLSPLKNRRDASRTWASRPPPLDTSMEQISRALGSLLALRLAEAYGRLVACDWRSRSDAESQAGLDFGEAANAVEGKTRARSVASGEKKKKTRPCPRPLLASRFFLSPRPPRPRSLGVPAQTRGFLFPRLSALLLSLSLSLRNKRTHKPKQNKKQRKNQAPRRQQARLLQCLARSRPRWQRPEAALLLLLLLLLLRSSSSSKEARRFSTWAAWAAAWAAEEARTEATSPGTTTSA